MGKHDSTTIFNFAWKSPIVQWFSSILYQKTLPVQYNDVHRFCTKKHDSSTIFKNLTENERQFNKKQTLPSDSVGGLPQGRLRVGSVFSRNCQQKSTKTLWLRRRFGEIPNLGCLKSLISGPQILVLGQGRLRAGSFFSRNYQQKSSKTRKMDNSLMIFNDLRGRHPTWSDSGHGTTSNSASIGKRNTYIYTTFRFAQD